VADDSSRQMATTKINALREELVRLGSRVRVVERSLRGKVVSGGHRTAPLARKPELDGGEAVTQCPVCESHRVVVVLSPDPRAFCVRCGARWVQDGSRQTRLERGDAAYSNPRRPRREP
jgi:hypothetical protein